MSRPRLLDLFSCAGGAAMGYHRAGFDVVGIDINPQPHYPFEHVQADALYYLKEHGHKFDAIHASPPCQRWSTATADHGRHPDLITPLRPILDELEKPYVIENVPAAPLRDTTVLCGSMFSLRVRRHRHFETSFPLAAPACDHSTQGAPVGVYGDHWDSREFLRPDGTRRGAKARSLAEGQVAMGIDWMPWRHLKEAIPPAYSHHIGTQLIEHLERS